MTERARWWACIALAVACVLALVGTLIFARSSSPAPQANLTTTFSPSTSISTHCKVDATAALNSFFAGLAANSTVTLPSKACYLVSQSAPSSTPACAPTTLLTICDTTGLTINANGATFRQTSYAGSNVHGEILTLGDNTNLTINHLTVYGPSSSGGGGVENDTGIKMYQNTGTTLNYVTMTNVEGDGLAVYPLGNTSGVNTDTIVNHSTIENMGYHSLVIEAAKNFTLENSVVSTNGSFGDVDNEVDFNCQGNLPDCGTLSAPGIGVVGMTFNNNYFPNGLALNDGESCMPVGSWTVENNNLGTGGLRLEMNTTYSLKADSLVDNPTHDSAGSSNEPGPWTTSVCGQYSGLTVTGNTSTGTSLTPCCGGDSAYFVLQGWTNVTISDNHLVFPSHGDIGVDLWGDSTVSIENNTFTNWFDAQETGNAAGAIGIGVGGNPYGQPAWPADTGITDCGNTYGPVGSPTVEAAC